MNKYTYLLIALPLFAGLQAKKATETQKISEINNKSGERAYLISYDEQYGEAALPGGIPLFGGISLPGELTRPEVPIYKGGEVHVITNSGQTIKDTTIEEREKLVLATEKGIKELPSKDIKSITIEKSGSVTVK